MILRARSGVRRDASYAGASRELGESPELKIQRLGHRARRERIRGAGLQHLSLQRQTSLVLSVLASRARFIIVRAMASTISTLTS
jgi:hypothetical protein